MGQTITSRLPDDLNAEIERIAKIEQLDKSSLIRRLLSKAIDEWNLSFAITQFQKGNISLGQAVELSRRSIWDVIGRLAELKIPVHYGVTEFDSDLKTLEEGFEK